MSSPAAFTISAGSSFLWLHLTPEGKPLITVTSDDAVRLWEVLLSKRDVKPLLDNAGRMC